MFWKGLNDVDNVVGLVLSQSDAELLNAVSEYDDQSVHVKRMLQVFNYVHGRLWLHIHLDPIDGCVDEPE